MSNVKKSIFKSAGPVENYATSDTLLIQHSALVLEQIAMTPTEIVKLIMENEPESIKMYFRATRFGTRVTRILERITK